jgi:hypothetical protein
MGYSNSKNVWQDTDEIVLFPEQTITTATAVNGDAYECGGRSSGCFEVVCSALTASDSLDVKIQTSKDGTGSGLGAWRDVASFVQLTGTGSERKSFAGLDRYIRAVVDGTDAGGGISFTVKVVGELKG